MTFIRMCAVISFSVMILSSVSFAAEKIDDSCSVTQEGIYISLPVFITSIIATAIFTWTVAKYDNKRIREVNKLKTDFHDLKRQLEEFINAQD